jgi:hypothetical protein
VTTGERAVTMFRFYRSDEPDRLVVAHGTNLQYYHTGSASWKAFGNLIVASAEYHIAQMNKALILCNGANRPRYFIKDSSDYFYPLGLDRVNYGTITATAATGGSLSTGTYKFLVTWYCGHTEKMVMEGQPANIQDTDLTVEITGSNNAINIQGMDTQDATGNATKKYIYRTRADGNVYYYDTNVDDADASATLTNADTALGAECESWDNYWAPHGKYPVVHKDRLFLGNGQHTYYDRNEGANKTVGNKSTLYFSKVGMPYAWPLENYIDCTPDDGDDINGVVSFAGRVFVFKPRKHFTLTYSADPLSGYVEEFRPGLLADRSPAVCDIRPNMPMGGMIWLARDKRVYLHDGQRAIPISDPIQDTLDAITLANLSYATGIFYPDRSWYMLSIDSSGTATRNDKTLVFDLDTMSWHEFNYGMAAFTYFGGAGDNNELLGGSLNDTAGFDVYQLDVGTTDSGAVIQGSYTSPPIPFGVYLEEKQPRKLFVEVFGTSAKTVQFDVYGNRETSSLKTYTLTCDGSEGQHQVISLNISPKRSYRIGCVTTASNFELIRFGFVWLSRREAYAARTVAGGIGPGEEEAS